MSLRFLTSMQVNNKSVHEVGDTRVPGVYSNII